MTRVYLSHYEQSRLNANSGRTQASGLLLKVSWPGNRVGYSDIMPFEQFFDPSVENCVENVKNFSWATLEGLFETAMKRPLLGIYDFVDLQSQLYSAVNLPKIVALSLFHNLIDVCLRERQQSCFAGLTVPESHLLVDGSVVQSLDHLMSCLNSAYAQGIKTVKFKATGHESDKVRLLKLIAHLPESPVQIRIDLNCSLSFQKLSDVLRGLGDCPGFKFLQFVEDPCTYVPEHWQELAALGMPLASDFAVVPPPLEAQYAVVKPVREAIAPYLASSQQLCVTHSMDHQIGQNVAAFWAALLQTHAPERMTLAGIAMNCESPQSKNELSFGHGFGCEAEMNLRSWQSL